MIGHGRKPELVVRGEGRWCALSGQTIKLLIFRARVGLENPVVPVELFRFDAAASIAAWAAIDDAVMGGLSTSRLRYDPAGHAVFEGEVSLEHGGGFASVRSAPRSLGVPLARYCLIEALGDGKRYKLNLRTDDAFDGVNYQAVFDPPAGAWTLLRVPLESFVPSFRGRRVVDAAPLDPANLRQVGLMISDRQGGRFALAVRSIGMA